MHKLAFQIVSAVNKTLLVAAYMHISILLFSALFFRDLKFMNTFFILDLHYLFPWIEKGYWSLLGGEIVFALIFLGFLVVSSRKQAK